MVMIVMIIINHYDDDVLQTAPWSVCFVIVGKLPGVVAPGISQQTANKHPLNQPCRVGLGVRVHSKQTKYFFKVESVFNA